MNNYPVALLVNDIHITKDTIADFEKNCQEILDVCRANNISYIFIGGDIFTTRNSQTLPVMLAVEKWLYKFTSESRSVYLANGNHDKIDLNAESGWCDVFKNMPGVYVVFDYLSWPIAEHEYLVMVPYFPEEGKMLDILSVIEKSMNPAEVTLYIHSGVHGALGDFDVPNELPQSVLSPYKKVLCGHYHNRAVISGTNVEYIGSSRAHTFGEDEEKGYTMLFSDASTVFVKNEVNTRYVTVDLNYKDVKRWRNQYDDRYKVRLKINCTAAEAETVDKEKLFAAGANKIEFMTDTLANISGANKDLEDKFNDAELQQEYKNFCNDKDIDSKLGIAYLNKTKTPCGI